MAVIEEIEEHNKNLTHVQLENKSVSQDNADNDSNNNVNPTTNQPTADSKYTENESKVDNLSKNIESIVDAEAMALEELEAVDNDTSENFHDCEGPEQPIPLKDPVKAQEEKESGNKYFAEKEFEKAIQCYSNAISLCPDGDDFNEKKAVYYGNRAACLLHQKLYDEVVEDCTKSLELKPDYVKVLMRRAQALEALERFEDALKDVTKVCEVDPSFQKAQLDKLRLKQICDERLEKLKEETMGKLKDLGNSVLGYFGMSLDNFAMEQDPNTGGYNISMKR